MVERTGVKDAYLDNNSSWERINSVLTLMTGMQGRDKD